MPAADLQGGAHRGDGLLRLDQEDAEAKLRDILAVAQRDVGYGGHDRISSGGFGCSHQLSLCSTARSWLTCTRRQHIGEPTRNHAGHPASSGPRGQTGDNAVMPRQRAVQASQNRTGCAGILWLMLRLPFMILRVIPHVGGILRGEAATDSGARARTSGEELTLADDQAVVAAALTKLKSQDAGFDLAATTRGVVRAREVVDLARQAGDASAAREVMSDGLWRVFVLLLAERTAHGVRCHGTSVVVGAEVVAVSRDQLAEQLRIRLSCQGERADHRAIDRALASRVGAEADELARIAGLAPRLDRLLRPLNQLGTQRFLREAREKVWANAIALSQARRRGPDTYSRLLAQLEELSAARVTVLQAPGQVLLVELAQIGFATPDLGQVSPQNLLGLLESATQVSKTGPASGDGWTGTAYSFSSTKDFGGPLHLMLSISGTVDVDQQGRVRQLDADYSIGKTEWKVKMTFGEFGVPVSVSAPPASEVFVPQ